MTKKKRKKFDVNTGHPLDIVVTTAGRYDILEKCLESLENQTVKTFNICLIDGNEDVTERNKHRPLLEKYQAKMLGQNVGFPRLANEGSRMGKSPLILFLSDDVILPVDAIEKMLVDMKEESIGIMGIKLLFPEDSVDAGRPAGKVQHVGIGMDVQANVIHPLVGWSADNPKCCISRDMFAVTGACILVRRNLFDKIGGFDVDYGLGTYEDISLCLAVRSMGKRVYLDADIIGYHHVGATAQKKKIGFPLQQNKLIFTAKWSPSGLFQFDSWRFY